MITNLEISYLCGTLILPLAMVLYVINHFYDNKNIYLYAIFMTATFFIFPAWFVVTIGLFLTGLDTVSKWTKERKDTCSYVELNK